ncbi:serine hydrolase domain-containing protein [Nesterenkonia muleiensis]|uniref:serine hydrolase domain-containing protein n=1 Tax=Nesterenkonia muleiensis TaxID=2282648 RepID=UPI00130057C5|nr:serine hydrolase domain-containing protein [Nesterenkonia muleiensis]
MTPGVTEQNTGQHQPPGAVLVVIEGDQRFVSVTGLADIETAEPMTEAHFHDLASVSKVLTTLTLQRLFSDGAAAPGDPLSRFLPEAGTHGEATLDDLLRHRAGFREWWPLYLMPHEDPVAAALSLDPRYPRGRGRHYSDLGMQAVGAVISRITGLGFAEAVIELLLEPLGVETVTPGSPPPGAPVTSGQYGDAIERDMVTTSTPHPVDAGTQTAAERFPWRRHLIRGEIGDCNAFHAFGTAAGHAGWFADAAGLLRIAEVLANPQKAGIRAETSASLSTEKDQVAHDQGQGQGVRTYRMQWRGQQRVFLGHPGFTGTFIAAAPAVGEYAQVLSVLLTNRLHGSPVPGRAHLMPVDTMWRTAMAGVHASFHPSRTGDPI